MLPLFPNLNPSPVDTAWFNVDLPCDDESELYKMENKLLKWRNNIKNWHSDLVPIGLPLNNAFEKQDEPADDTRVNDEDNNLNNIEEEEEFIDVVELEDEQDEEDDEEESDDEDIIEDVEELEQPYSPRV
ncbi:PREDICTED: anaphase-promoting complex subunit 15B-like [Nicrophorus vespilloides]|uniref:Anaphase-promoting complex subunit 15B-like n=1 Tax=Nicrophorus vespilloides TaxID=110193 RepID=A0ABM1MNR3_NICVS|nr:PREDICTED: anaphase-promoting complex subunit 15B-like [Nicrophorus vespilloides]